MPLASYIRFDQNIHNFVFYDAGDDVGQTFLYCGPTKWLLPYYLLHQQHGPGGSRCSCSVQSLIHFYFYTFQITKWMSSTHGASGAFVVRFLQPLKFIVNKARWKYV